MKQKRTLSFTLLMAIVMMAMSPAMAWAQSYDTSMTLKSVEYSQTGSTVVVTFCRLIPGSKARTAYNWSTSNLTLKVDDTVVSSNLHNDTGASINTMVTMGNGADLGNSFDISINNTKVGTVKVCDFPDDTDTQHYYASLQLDFNSDFSFYGHKITLTGDWGLGTARTSTTLTVDVPGYPRPTSLSATKSSSNVSLSWTSEKYNTSTSTAGNWYIYRNNVSLGSVEYGTSSYTDQSPICAAATYQVVFVPSTLTASTSIPGLSKSSSQVTMGHSYSVNGLCTRTTNETHYEPCSGSGTTASPYLINNAGKLIWFRDQVNGGNSTTHAKLTDNIDMDGVAWSNAIGENTNGYTCTFNGNGYSIKNMNNGTWVANVGGGSNRLFATIGTGGKLTNLDCSNINIVLSITNMALVGINYGTIEKVQMHGGTCQYHVAGGPRGGICAQNYGIIDNCGIHDISFRNRRGATVPWLYMGAICGINHDNAIIRNCYTWGVKYVDGFRGYNAILDPLQTQSGTVTNCYTDNIGTAISGVTDVTSGITATFVTSGELCYKLNGGETNGSQAWRQTLTGTSADVFPVTINTHNTVYRNTNYYCDRATLKNYSYSNSANADSYDAHEYNDNGFCYGTAGKEHLEPARMISNHYEVGNAGQLYSYAQSPDLDLYLTKDITVNAQVLNADRSLVTDVSNLRSWEPLQNSDNIFSKNVYGNGHTISGLYCNMPDGQYAGFIKKLQGSVEKLSIVDSYFHGAYNVGAIATSMDAKNISINNCYVNANVSATGGVSPSYVGGITSYTDYSVTLRNNLAIVTATGADNTTIGGIIAVTQQTYYDTNCLYNTSNMKCFGNINESAYSNATNFSDITDKELSSGVVAWYLNECKYDNCTWYQTLGESGDAVPHLTSKGNDTVYGALGVFTNTRNNDEKNTITVPLTYYQPTGKYYGAVWSDLPVEIINDGHSKVYGEVIRRAYPQMDYYHARLYTKNGERYLDHEGVFIVSDQPTINVAYIINTPDKTIYSKPNGNAYYKGSPRAYTCQDVDLVFGGKDGVIGFYQYTGKTVSPYKARLQNTGDKETLLLPLAKGYAIEFEDEEETTAVETLEDATYNMTNNAVVGIYDINGVQQESMKPGINIVRMADGTTRKIFIK